MIKQEAQDACLDMIDFINASYTAAYAVRETSNRLEKAGFKRIFEKDKWNLKSGDKFYVVRRFSSIIAGKIGTAPFEEAGFRIAGAHTDSPGFRLKPNALYEKNGYVQFGVEI